MLSKTEALIRLAHIFEDHGLHSTADIIDGRMWRIALDLSDVSPEHDETTEKYKRVLDNAYRSQFKVKPADSNFSSYRNQESYWVYPDGNVVVLDGVYHGDAILQVENKQRVENGQKLGKDPEYREFQGRYFDNYHMVGNVLGAIRVYAEVGSRLVVTSYTAPTPEQINAIENIRQYWGSNGFNIEQFGNVLGLRAKFESIPEWEIAVEKYQRAQAASGDAPASSQFQDTIRKVDEESHTSNEPYWKAMDKRNLEERYPGEENAPFRKMYERSAGTRLSEQLTMDFDAEPELSAEELEQDGRTKLMNAWVQTYPLRSPKERVQHTEGGMYNGSQSFWVLPDGSRIELGTTWHGSALANVVRENDLENHEGVKQMRRKHDGDYYAMMGHYYDAVRLFAYGGSNGSLAGSSFSLPTPEQFQTIKNILSGLGLSKIEVGQKMPDGSMEYFYSLDAWQAAVESKRPPKPKRTIDKQLESEKSNDQLWRVIERRNLEERYPGDENAQFRRMYQRSASAQSFDDDNDYNQDKPPSWAIVGTSGWSNDSELKDIKDKVYQAWVTNHNMVPPKKPVTNLRERGSSFWVMPDGSRIELGIWNHGTALSELIYENDLHHHPGYDDFMIGGTYSTMGAHYGAIRVYAYGGSLSVSSYSKPTSAQFETVAAIAEAANASDITIEQVSDSNHTREMKICKSIDEWKSVISKGDSYQQTDLVKTTKDIDSINDISSWKGREKARLLEQYPGDSNAPLRKMYERAASTRSASKDDYYKKALEEGHKARFKILEPQQPVEQFRNMHSFWLYPDGRVMDLGKQWHEDAFNNVMQEAGLDAEEEFGKMYSSKDGPHEIMSDYFGMIRLFLQDKNIMVVTSYLKPTQAQVDQIQNIAQQSGRSVIKIEQYGHVNGGRLVTNSMAKWIDELSKYRPNAEGKSSYNTMRNEVDEANAAAAEQPYWKAREQQSLETAYPGPENEKLRKMYERSASNGC